jgi:peptide methionine sulfoxide reductase MsrB
MKFSLQVNDGTCKHEDPTCKVDESLANENLKSKKMIYRNYIGVLAKVQCAKSMFDSVSKANCGIPAFCDAGI